MDSNIGRKDLDLQDNDYVELKKRLLGATTEIGTGIGTDLLTGSLLNPATIAGTKGLSILAYAGINGFQGAYTNYLVQKHLYGADNVNWGEILSSGALSAIPFMNLKAGKNVANIVGDANTVRRGIVGGAGLSLAGEQLRVGIDEQRLLSPLEAGTAIGLGGGIGGGLTQLSKLGKSPQLSKPRKAPKRIMTDQEIRSRGELKSWRQKDQTKFDPAANQEKMDEAVEIAEKLGKDPEDYLVEQGLLHRLSFSINNENFQPRSAAINTVNTNIKGVIAKLNHTAIELGYEPPSTTLKLRKPPKRYADVPDDIYTIYTAHEEAYWNHIKATISSKPGAKIDMRSFPDLIHNGITYRPNPVPNTIKEGPDAGKQILKWTGIKDRNERMSEGKLGRTRRLDKLNELNTYSGSSTKRWLQSRQSKIDELNDRLVAEGKHPIGEVESVSGLHGDHRFPIALTQAFGAGLSPKYKKIVYGHIVRAGGYLGDEIDNVVILNKTINIQKESKLKYYTKLRRHKSAQSFGKFDKKNPKSYQTEAEQRARVEYYTTPRKETGLTPIEEFVQDVYKAEQWAEEQMDALLSGLERVFPEELDYLPESELKIILEVFGDKESAKAFIQRLRDNEAAGMPKAMIRDLIDGEIWNRLTDRFK